MILTNLKIVTLSRVIEKGYVEIEKDTIKTIGEGDYLGNEESIDTQGKIIMPGFIDLHIHGSCGIDFMDADVEGFKTIANALYSEGTTTFLATTLTSDKESLSKVAKTVKEAMAVVPSLGGIHFEGPYINAKYKGAQNEAYIRNPSIEEFDYLNDLSGGNVRYITLAPEKDGAMEFIKHVREKGVVVSAGHSDATFDQIEEAIGYGLTNTTHTHNAMSGHHHRNPGIVTAAFYFDELYTECISDLIHVSKNALKTMYKIVGNDRFMIVTDALLGKHSAINEFKLFGLDCVKRDGAAYLTSGPLAGSLLTMDQGIRNIRSITGENLIGLSKISSYNQAKCLNLNDRGEIAVGKLADFVLLDEELQVKEVYKLGKKVFSK